MGMAHHQSDYEKFVNTAALLACQRPLESLVSSHELFFQVTHQVMELWMKVIAYELRVAVDEINRNDAGEAVLRLHRVREIERVLTDQITVMETLSPADYHPIRMTLGHGSGSESPGFAEIAAVHLVDRDVKLVGDHLHPELHHLVRHLEEEFVGVDEAFERSLARQERRSVHELVVVALVMGHPHYNTASQGAQI